MPNLDLTIAKIMQGDTPVLRIMEGDTKVWPSGTDVAVDGVLTNVTSSVSIPGTVPLNSPLTITLTPDTSCIINQISVTMDGIDITSTAYNEGVITIASVTGDIIIHASAIEVITFEDANVKAICVSNWGGNVIEGEITPTEVSQITALNGVFRGNTTITKFNEFRYFTGITTFTHPSGNNAQGEFYGCTALEEITFPSINIQRGDFMGLLRNCNKLKSVDLSPIVANSYHINYMMYLSYSSNTVEKITLPGGYYGGSYSSSSGLSYARYAMRDCSHLVTLEIKGIADWSGISAYQESGGAASSIFYRCTSLTNIIGTITDIKADLYLGWCSSLTRDSLLVIINGLADLTGKTGKTLTLDSSAKARLTADDIAIATAKNWTIV